MDPRYERNIPALTEEECMTLRQKRVLVAGCGGLGGFLIEYLARIGVGAIRAVDGDVFEPSNLNRQLLSAVPLLGTSKAKAAADRIRGINPDVQIEAVEEFITEANAVQLLTSCDAVLDGLDNIHSRKILATACKKAGIPYIYGAIGGWNVQAAISMPGDGLIDVLYPPHVVVKNKSALSFTPALCASLQAALCTKLLCGHPVETGKLYLLDLQHMEWNAFSI